MKGKDEGSKRITGVIKMEKIELTQLIEAGAHFGHLTRRWNPKMKPFIFMEKNGIHIIDLKKTQNSIVYAAESLSKLVSEGKKRASLFDVQDHLIKLDTLYTSLLRTKSNQ